VTADKSRGKSKRELAVRKTDGEESVFLPPLTDFQYQYYCNSTPENIAVCKAMQQEAKYLNCLIL
jgi:hypothetical protein